MNTKIFLPFLLLLLTAFIAAATIAPTALS